METGAEDNFNPNDILHLNYGAKAVKILGEDLEEVQRLQDFGKTGAIRFLSSRTIYPFLFCKQQNALIDYEYRESDVFIDGYLRSGTTMMQEMVWTILHNYDDNNPSQDKQTPFERCPVFDMSTKYDMEIKWIKAHLTELAKYLQCDTEMSLVDMFKLLPDPRVYKCHITPEIMNPKLLEKSKVIYMIRNPFDSFLSLYHLSKTFYFNNFRGDLQEFFHSYMKELIMPGTSIQHIKAWWPYRNHKNVCFIYFEDVQKNPELQIRKISSFLGKDLTDQQLNNVLRLTKFDKMKQRFSRSEEDTNEISKVANISEMEKTGGFFRKGKSNLSKETLPQEMSEKLAKYFKEEAKDLNLPYKF